MSERERLMFESDLTRSNIRLHPFTLSASSSEAVAGRGSCDRTGNAACCNVQAGRAPN